MPSLLACYDEREASHRPAVVAAAPGRHRFYAVASALLFLTALIRYWTPFLPAASIPREPESYRIAHNLYESGKFANPFPALDTGPSAHLAPAFPFFAAFLMAAFGDKAAGLFALKLAAVAAVASQVALFPVFSRRLGMGEFNGVIAACIWIAAKPRLIYEWEALYAAVLIAATACLYRCYLDPHAQIRRCLPWFTGCLTGLLLLTAPTIAPVLAAWLALAMLQRKRAFARIFPVMLIAGTITTPWIIRNYVVFHRLVFVRDNLGLELSVSNNDCARFGIKENIASGCFERVHPYLNRNVAAYLMQAGEAQYNSLRLREAIHWIVGHPDRFLELTRMRFLAFWMPSEAGIASAIAQGRGVERSTIYALTLLALSGLFNLFRRDWRSAAMCVCCLTLFPLIYYFVQFEDRYRYPILWMTFLLGSVPITRCVLHFGRKLLGEFDGLRVVPVPERTS